jgi:phosphoribosyl 1,2-cyclic phosphate phosphodiesterase
VARLQFLGTGASGGTPGRGRSRRRESSLLAEAENNVLIDVTRDFSDQARRLERIDAILITHAHRDASGGISQLRSWWRERGACDPIPVYAHRDTFAAIRRRTSRLDHCRFVETRAGSARGLGRWTVTALGVPHAREPHRPTFAWRLRDDTGSIVYASDVACLTAQLRRFASGASLLVIDGAMWGRKLFSHLTIDAELPGLCDWDVETILLTQIGKTLPPHDRLEREVRRLCARARPAHDGLVVAIPG